MWKRIAVLVVVALLPMSAVAHTRLFYRKSYQSDYRKVEVVTMTPEPTLTPEPTETPCVEILLESPQTPAPELTEMPTEVLTSTPEDVDASDQTTTQTDISTISTEVL